MKNETFYVRIETKENGYAVQRDKHIFPKYDRACVLTMLEECHKWMAKKVEFPDRMSIEIIGNGTAKWFNQSSIIRFINRSNDSFAVIWFGEKQTGEAEEFTKKSEAIRRFDALYKERIGDYIEYDPED